MATRLIAFYKFFHIQKYQICYERMSKMIQKYQQQQKNIHRDAVINYIRLGLGCYFNCAVWHRCLLGENHQKLLFRKQQHNLFRSVSARDFMITAILFICQTISVGLFHFLLLLLFYSISLCHFNLSIRY